MVPTTEIEHWRRLTKVAWLHACNGDIEQARKRYDEADSLDFTEFHHNADLAVLRHSKGEGDGRIIAPPISEDEVKSFAVISSDVTEAPDAYGLKYPEINGKKLEENIRKFISYVKLGFHKENIKKELPHVMVISTGRCGTMSLYRLFEQSRLMAFHSYMWTPNGIAQTEAMCRFMDGNYDSMIPFSDYLQCRSAEYIGAVNEDRPLISLLHLDTIFAPVFAAWHPKGKIIYLRRDPVKVYQSFYGKSQWNKHQLNPVFYDFKPEFAWRRLALDLTPRLAWYIYFIEEFCWAMFRVFCIEGREMAIIDADLLFAQDEHEIMRLLHFAECGLPLGRVTDHFKTKYNEKPHKQILTPEGLELVTEVFKGNYEQIQKDGRL